MTPNEPRPRYTWPWFVLGAFILAVVLAVIWVSVLVHRTREQRDPDPLFTPEHTNAARP